MSFPREALHVAAIAGFIALGVTAIRAWVRAPTRANAAVAAALGSLGALALGWFINDVTNFGNRIVSDLSVAAFLASGYGVSAIRNAFVPFKPPTRIALITATIAAGVLHAVSRPSLGLHPHYSSVQWAVLWLVIGVWLISAGPPIVTLWRAGRRLPAVQRARVRTLAAGNFGLVSLIVGYAWTAPRGAVAGHAVVISLSGLLLLPILWVAFSPPPILRRLWRAREEEALRAAVHELLLGSGDGRSMAEAAIAWAVRLMGADGGCFVTFDGDVLAATGGRADLARAIGRGERPADEVASIVVPLPIDGRDAALVVVGGAFTPVFGSDELSRLDQWAGEVAIAFDRLSVIGELQAQTQTREGMLRALSDLGEGVVVGTQDRLLYVNEAYSQMVGYTPDELRALPNIYELVHPEDRERASGNAFRRRSGLPTPDRYDLRLVRRDGDLIEVELAVKPYEIAGPGAFIGIFREITARKQAVAAARESEARAITAREALARETTLLRLLQDVAATANQSEDVVEVLQLTIDLVCRRTGWPVGHVYLADDEPSRGMAPSSIWYFSNERQFRDLRRLTEALRLSRGTGLPGLVLERRSPVWIEEDGSREEPLAVRFGAGVGVRSGFGFPVFVGDDVVAVLEFFSPDQVPRDEQLLGVLGFIGGQIGLVFERARAKSELERREAQLNDAQAIASIGSWEWVVESDHVTWSAELYRIFGLDSTSFTATFEGFLDRVHPEDRARARRTVEGALHERASFGFDHRIVRPDGTVRMIQARGETVLDERGVPVRMVGTGQDVTEQRKAEHALRSAYERERQALDQLRRLDEMKSAILSAVSHELRTPLTVILGFAQTLQREDLAISEVDRASFMERIASNAVKLDRLLSDLLDLDRLDRRILEPRRRPTDLKELTVRVVEQCGIQSTHRVTVQAEPVVIRVDAPRVERIIENLLVNAARHTPERSRVWVDVLPATAGAEIVVSDDGAGVPSDQRATIFEPFRQGPNAPSHSPGVGIGLSLVARFAEMHGGRAWVEERPGGGAAFHVFLPDGPAETAPDPRAAIPRPIVGDVKAG